MPMDRTGGVTAKLDTQTVVDQFRKQLADFAEDGAPLLSATEAADLATKGKAMLNSARDPGSAALGMRQVLADFERGLQMASMMPSFTRDEVVDSAGDKHLAKLDAVFANVVARGGYTPPTSVSADSEFAKGVHSIDRLDKGQGLVPLTPRMLFDHIDAEMAGLDWTGLKGAAAGTLKRTAMQRAEVLLAYVNGQIAADGMTGAIARTLYAELLTGKMSPERKQEIEAVPATDRRQAAAAIQKERQAHRASNGYAAHRYAEVLEACATMLGVDAAPRPAVDTAAVRASAVRFVNKEMRTELADQGATLDAGRVKIIDLPQAADRKNFEEFLGLFAGKTRSLSPDDYALARVPLTGAGADDGFSVLLERRDLKWTPVGVLEKVIRLGSL
ncbi:MAG: hypothetical protein HY903_16755 [Deltaproteobacteria bacterium]|nr:hypothetical protein [Deltaproteobacteria bacterium]